ncbi:ankyrin repeat-containing domain protein [Massariosphaeria phaeospora]|uniref:Ankyrin repeat-containing domain protein n=1 Tax=Massariosphaeria phaeospora TaxID=100035 RepID=A0A7C8ID91_9PLEO|nr:ankyrin repeat-containing domain protein [Massariosphaeria phaeospora]
MWLFGLPGCGKSILCSSVVDDVQEHCRDDPDWVMAYFYFDFNDAEFQDPDAMIKSLITQLFRYSIQTSVEVDKHYDSCEKGRLKPSPTAALDILRLLIEEHPGTYIVLDALDECKQRDDLLRVLSTMLQWNAASLHLLVTSREEPEIVEALESLVAKKNAICLQNNDVEKDVQVYIQDRLGKWEKHRKMHQEIETKLCKHAEGITAQVNNVLKTLPTTLDETYERILMSFPDIHQEYALRMLHWLTFSKRPMRLREIAEVIAINRDNEPAFDEDDKLEDPLDALMICGSLFTVIPLEEEAIRYNPFGFGADNTDEIDADVSIVEQRARAHHQIVLSHQSVKEYLITDRIGSSPASRYRLSPLESHTMLAKTCIAYLMEVPHRGLQRNEITRKFALTRYAAESWFLHASFCEPNVDKSLVGMMTRLLSTDEPTFHFWLSFHDPMTKRRRRFTTKTPSPLYYASMLGLASAVRSLLDRDPGTANKTTKDSRETPLSVASAEGHLGVVELLLERGANVNHLYPTASDKRGTAVIPLVLASSHGHDKVVDKLITANATVWFGEALKRGIEGYHIKTIERLLKSEHSIPTLGFDIERTFFNGKGSVRGTILHFLVYQNWTGEHPQSSKILQILLDNGAKMILETSNEDGMTPLTFAIVRLFGTREPTVMEKLLYNGANVHAKCKLGRTAVHWLLDGTKFFARESEIIKSLDLLFKYGADVDAVDSEGRTACHMAVWKPNVLERILREHPDTNIRDDCGITPFHFAALADNTHSMIALFSAGAELDPRNEDGLTPLHLLYRAAEKTTSPQCKINWVWWSSYTEWRLESIKLETVVHTVEFLLRKGANVNTVNKDGDTLLHTTAVYQDSHIMLCR